MQVIITRDIIPLKRKIYRCMFSINIYCVRNVYKQIDRCVISVYNGIARRNTNETKRFDQKA